MDAKRVRGADWLTGLAGLLVLGSLWLRWYSVGPGTANAWSVLSISDAVIALAAACAVLTLVLTLANDSPAKPVAAGVVTLALSAIAVLIVLYRVIINVPGPNDLVGVEPAGYLGAALVLGLFAAALACVRNESSPHQAPIQPEQLPAPDVGSGER